MKTIWYNEILEPMTVKNDYNKLDINNYLLSPYIHNLITDASQINFGDNNLDGGIYLVCFRSLNNNSNNKLLIYNYMYFDHELYLSIIVYFVLRDYYIKNLDYKEWGYYSVFLDKQFLSLDRVNSYIENTKGINSKWVSKEVENSFSSYLNNRTNGDILLEFITKCIHIKDYEDMSMIIDKGFNKDILSFINFIFKENYTDKDIHLTKNFSVLNSSLFVVSDIKRLIEGIKSKGFSINQGPQKWRGQINSMNSFLSYLDVDYRHSLYNHYKHHEYNLNHNYKPSLSRRHFSFRNIHNNLGNVRWYTTSRKLSNRQQLFDTSYMSVTNIINSNKNLNKENIQMNIENFLHNQEKIYFDDSIAKNALNFSESNFDFIQEKAVELNKSMSDWDNIKEFSKSKTQIYRPWIKNISKELKSKKITEMLIELFMFMVSKETINIKEFQTPGIPTLRIYNQFGRSIVNKYIYSLYKKYINENNMISLSQFKNNNYNMFKDIYEDNFHTIVGGSFVWNLSVVGLIYEEIDSKSMNSKEEMLYLRVNDNARNMFIKNNHKIYHLPLKLPMVCEPKDFVYSNNSMENKLGGYLLNDVQYTDYIFKDKIGYGKPTILEENNFIVSLINGLSKTPYKINQETLDFVYQYGMDKKILLDRNSNEYKKFIKNPYKKLSSRDSKKYRSMLSKIILEKNILSIAETYSNIDKIYFPVRLDFRTRIYCETDYFDYQKSDLAKGLISFTEPGCLYKHNIQAINYFKAYGGNMFGDGLDKKSLNYKVKWIDDNSDRILNFENNNIVELAENKVCFVSFCFEYRRFIDFIKDKNSVKFYTYLPIQLDASCNGYQHLALLTKEVKLFNKLNLDASTFDDMPDDFYIYILNKTVEHINNKINVLSKQKELSDKEKKTYNSCITLSKVKFDRSIVKKAIMIESYGGSLITQTNGMIANFEENSEGKNKYYTYKNDIKFKRYDIIIFVMCIKEVVANESPRIAELSKYLDSIVSICTKLSTPVPWALPSGAVINESYYLEKKINIKAFSFVKSKYTFKKYIKDKYDLTQLKQATMPNLIHSLDATSIALLYEDFKKVGVLYTVHDCFATTANNVPELISLLKLVYIKIYSNDGYLSKFDKLVRYNISNTFGDNVFKIDDNIVYIKNPDKKKIVPYPYPDINKVLNLNLSKIDNIDKSSYILV